MALTPPAYGWSSVDLGPDLGMSSVRSEGGIVVTSRRGDPFVTGKLTTRALKPDQFADMQAFVVDACDRNERIDVVNPRYRLPRAYTDATWPLITDPAISAITDLYHLSLSGLQTGMTLKRGDRLCIVQENVGGGESVAYRWLAADVTVTSAIAQAVQITPRLPMGIFAVAATVKFKNPFARLAIVPGTIEAVITDDYLTSITFEVSEALR